MADEHGDQLVTEAEQASLSSLAHDLGSLFAARSSNGDVVFTFPAENGVEERAHRLIIAVRSKYFAALLARADADTPIPLVDFTSPVFQQLLAWMYTARLPTGMEAEDDLHELLRAANFLTLTECVQAVVARVVADMVPETAAPWLLFAEEGTLGAFDDTLKMNALGCLLASIGIVPPGTAVAASASKCIISPEVLALLRGALQRCTVQECVRLRLSFMRVMPGDAEACAWVVGAEPLLVSPRSPARRPITFINLRAAPIDVMWIGFDGEERRYTRAQDNVDSTIQPGRSTSWSSVVSHMWRIYDTDSHEWLGGVEVELPPPPVPATMVSLEELLRRVQVSGLEPLPPPVGKLAKSSHQYGHQLFCII